jgi:tetratricopeptide (TPR) repeat protein
MKLVLAALASAILFGSSIPARPALPQASAAGDFSGIEQQFDTGNYAAAITTLRAITSQDPSSALAHYWLGRCYYEVKNYDNSVAEFSKAVQADANSSLYHQWLGRAYGAKADRDRSFLTARKVKKEFEDAVKLNPSNISARRDLEDYLLEAPWIVGGSKPEALEQVTAIEKLDPLEGHLARGDYDLHLADSAGAAKESAAALDPMPQNIETFFEIADYYGKVGNGEQVDRVATDAEKLNPKDPRLAYYHGESRILMGTDLIEAEQDLKAYLATSPDRSDWPSHSAARYWLGRLYELEGKEMDAAEQFRASLQLDPGRKDAKRRLEELEKSIH